MIEMSLPFYGGMLFAIVGYSYCLIKSYSQSHGSGNKEENP